MNYKFKSDEIHRRVVASYRSKFGVMLLRFQISTTGFVGISLSRKTAVESLMELPRKLVTGNSASATSGIISASGDGVWVFMPSHTVLNVCRSSITGES